MLDLVENLNLHLKRYHIKEENPFSSSLFQNPNFIKWHNRDVSMGTKGWGHDIVRGKNKKTCY